MVPRWLARLILRLGGWRAVGGMPDLPKCVVVVYPHTSNWDFVWLMRALGGIPVDRRASHDMVEQMAAQFAARERLVLALAPEGTRGHVEEWKSGFYHIARAADVPVLLAYADYPTRTGGLGPSIHLTDDVRADMDRIRAFYADKRGKFPELMGRIRLKEEA